MIYGLGEVVFTHKEKNGVPVNQPGEGISSGLMCLFAYRASLH
jgi:hypothetical protein